MGSIFNEKDYVGKKYGRLIIVEFTKIIKKNRWITRKCLCRCECGNIKEYYFNNLRSEEHTSELQSH